MTEKQKTSKLYHATTTCAAREIIERGWHGGKVWDHPGVVFFADRPLGGFGDLSGSSWIVIEANDALLALNQYLPDELGWDEDQYGARCFCLPVAAVNQLSRQEEQGL